MNAAKPEGTIPLDYDHIGVGYNRTRQADPVLARRIWDALGEARTVLNAGAGAGSYEPTDRCVIAVEPSTVMIRQRPSGAAPVVQASVEQLPLADRTVDAAMAVLTLHHWQNVDRGIQELLRVARYRIVLVTMDADRLGDLWIVRDYLPELLGRHASRFPSIVHLRELLPRSSVDCLPVPCDCRDGFMAAFWARPHCYLDPRIRAGTSPWSDLPREVMDRGLAKLSRDLRDGHWHRRYGELLDCNELDVGLRLITSFK